MPVLILIGALLLGARIYRRHRRGQHLALRPRREDAQRWEDDGGALRAPRE
jgi:hypothetical protein